MDHINDLLGSLAETLEWYWIYAPTARLILALIHPTPSSPSYSFHPQGRRTMHGVIVVAQCERQ